MYISVTVLRKEGKRLSVHSIKTQWPTVGWLHYEVDGDSVRASVRRADGGELLSLDHARLIACRGTKGALIEGVEYRKKGRKHSISDRQSWWCEAPPRRKPMLDGRAHFLAWQRLTQGQLLAGWGAD